MSQETKPRVWPEGTMIVITTRLVPHDGSMERPEGASAVIARSPDSPEHDRYVTRFPDGHELVVSRDDFEILKHYQRGDIGDSMVSATQYDLYEHVHYRCVVGSRAYGLSRPDSDTDVRGFYVAPASVHWSLYGAPEQLEPPDRDVCFWEVEKFIRLALKANPNVLECLYTPLVEHCSEIGRAVIEARSVFLSRMIYQTYYRYVHSQFRALSKKKARGEEPNPKHMMHLIRLMESGLCVLREGFRAGGRGAGASPSGCWRSSAARWGSTRSRRGA